MILSRTPDQSNVRGYVEGYYGKLLGWHDRCELAECLAALQLNTYCYAPKEDVQHRLQWRDEYSPQWRESFQEFCNYSSGCGINVVAGIAPGLNFDFSRNGYALDFETLCSKAGHFLADGANDILILWDDIEAGFNTENCAMSEGVAHARVVNELSDKLAHPLWVTPRVYAMEIENDNHYLEDFFSELDSQHTVLLCGNAIVSGSVDQADLLNLSPAGNHEDCKHRTVLWDNFYANDYCPRRLFIGPWTGRETISSYLINPTGMPYTDRLLLDVACSTQTTGDRLNAWLAALKRHGVPDAFKTIAPYFTKPVFGDEPIAEVIEAAIPTTETEQVIEECLWRWKSPLAREWYPFIMSLKHDLALMQNKLPRDRVLKTQTPALAKRLLS